MNDNEQTTVNTFTETTSQRLKQCADYQELKLALMQAEIELGAMEREILQNGKTDRAYLAALDGAWSTFCEVAIARAEEMARHDKTLAKDLKASPKSLKMGLYDNYLHAAFAAAIAARKNPQIKKLPLLAEAAFNKHSYLGWMDEIACLRLLLWAGFDPNARNDSGDTALIYMASLRTRLVSHPRAIRLLLGVGANPNLTNKMGDTALCYLSGNKNWFAAHTVAAWQLLDGGANPFVKANDGECAYSMWQRHKQGSKDIEGILAAVEGFAAQRYGVFAKC
jgi:hypothetical protein